MAAGLDRAAIKANGWKLGSCFTAISCEQLFLALPEALREKEAVYIVVTHDCSLINPSLESEPTLEFFVAKAVEKSDPSFTHAKNIRRLQIPLRIGDAEKDYELRMAKRGFVGREPLEGCIPDVTYELPPESKAILIRWLSNRYTTQTLPDAFDQRIKPLLEGKKKPLRKLLQRSEASKMLGIYIDLEPPDKDLPQSKKYDLTVVLLYEDDAVRGNESLYDAYAEDIKACLKSA